MECEACESDLIDFVHGELERERHVEVARHLANCSGCALASCRLRADLDGISALVQEAPRPEVRAALRAQVEQTFAPARRVRLGRLWMRPVPVYQAVLIAAAAAALLLVIQALPERDPASTTPELRDASPILEGVDATEPLFDRSLS